MGRRRSIGADMPTTTVGASDVLNPFFDNDKRRYIRYEVLDYACIRVDEGEAVHAVIVDIGLGGLQVRTRATFELGSLCTIEIGREDQAPMVFHGEVRHFAPVADTDLHGVGIRFKPKDHPERLAVAEYVHSVFQRQCELLIQ